MNKALRKWQFYYFTGLRPWLPICGPYGAIYPSRGRTM